MVFFLFTFEYVEFVCCLVLNNYMINANESFDNMNLNMKSVGKHTYIWNYQIFQLPLHVVVFAWDDDLDIVNNFHFNN